MRNWGAVTASFTLVALVLVGCSSEPEQEDAADVPNDPLDQMLISFNGDPSKREIQEALDDAFAATETAPTADNYSRAGSVLVTFRQEHGIDEMDILECIPTSANDPRVEDNSFGSIAAVCLTDIVSTGG